jgi:hypothetical protein
MGAFVFVFALVVAFCTAPYVTGQFAVDAAGHLRVRYNETLDLVRTLLLEAAFASYDGAGYNEARRLEHVAGNWKDDGINAWLWGRVSNLSANSKNMATRTGYGRQTVVHTRAMSFLCSPGLYPNYFPYNEVGTQQSLKLQFSQAFNLSGLIRPQGHLTDCLVAEPPGFEARMPKNQQALILNTDVATLNITLRLFGQNSWVNVLSLETKVGECRAVFSRGNATDVVVVPQSGSLSTIQQLNQQLCQGSSGQLLHLYSTYITPDAISFDVQLIKGSPYNEQFQVVHNQRFVGWTALLNARMQQREVLSHSRASPTKISLAIVTVLGALVGGDWLQTSVQKLADKLSSRWRLHGIGKVCLVAIFVGVSELAEVAIEVWPLVGLTIREYKAQHVVDMSCDIGAETSAATRVGNVYAGTIAIACSKLSYQSTNFTKILPITVILVIVSLVVAGWRIFHIKQKLSSEWFHRGKQSAIQLQNYD